MKHYNKNIIKILEMRYPKETSKKKRRFCLVSCETCKKEQEVQLPIIKNKINYYCNSCSKKTHGKSKTRLYKIWHAMKRRCYDKKIPTYKWYGKLGITINKKWINYVEFEKWALKNGYEEHLTIDRIDSSKNYEPNNCQWITKSENSTKSNIRENINRNKHIKISNDEATKICEALDLKLFSQKEISEYYNVHFSTISFLYRKYKKEKK